MNKSQKQNVNPTFSQPFVNAPVSSFWAFLPTEITDFPTLKYTLTSEMPSLSQVEQKKQQQQQANNNFIYFSILTWLPGITYIIYVINLKSK